MKYSKPALTREQQADLLISRGMMGDRDHIISQLSAVNYYRLSGYWHTFRLSGSHDFSPNTTFDKVWLRYVFDRRLRLSVVDALERLEVYFRGQLAYQFAHQFNCPFAYADDPAALPNLRSDRRNRFLTMLADDLGSWLLALNTTRNICAHHSRLWNRKLGTMPMIPNRKNDPNWHDPVPVGNDRVFGVLTILKYSLDRISPQSSWTARVMDLLDSYPTIPLKSMGFPNDWKNCPIWSTKPSN